MRMRMHPRCAVVILAVVVLGGCDSESFVPSRPAGAGRAGVAEHPARPTAPGARTSAAGRDQHGGQGRSS